MAPPPSVTVAHSPLSSDARGSPQSAVTTMVEGTLRTGKHSPPLRIESTRSADSPSAKARRLAAQRRTRAASMGALALDTTSNGTGTGRTGTKQQLETKGVWIEAAAFIALSHVLIGLYALAYLHARVTGEVHPYGSVYHVSWRMLALTLFAAWLNLLGITAGYHRLWSHNSYKATTGLRIFLAIIGLCSFQGSARWWVLKHRLHHRFTDTPNDPYDSTRGLWYTHIGWLFEPSPYIEKVQLISMKDVDQDPVVAFQKRYLLHGYVLFGALLPGLLGLWIGDSFWAGVLWIGFVGRFLSWHCIWTINSLSHWHGYKEFSRVSSAVYVQILNLVQNGEGHHNRHHAFPTDYRHGCILLWWHFGLAYDLVTITPNEVVQARAQVLVQEAAEAHAQAVWPIPLDQLPVWSEEEFRARAEKTKGESVLCRLRSSVLDVSEFTSHPGGFAFLRSYHGRDITDAFEGGINLHTQAAQNLADMYRIARIQ